MRLSSGRVPDEPEISLVSLIDVVFCLIIFLVVTTTFDHRSALRIVLPATDSRAEVQLEQPMTVLIDADGRVYIGENEVLKTDPASLRAALSQAAGGNRERQVVVRADARSRTQSLVTVMDSLGQLGFTRIHLATAPEARP
ncbi:biopolymer transporter ExbD [Arenimonas caeni]|uniref:ExbD/TolR family protein n=1 Tax=Arenimonas caeni TaxID=2058085 RepID=UPI002A36D6B8|nr:biopolymer transporter ExbD [Arenimonas caeni]MDY0022746.1 biopolymer transporter ExbD [Arenimonas caeni]